MLSILMACTGPSPDTAADSAPLDWSVLEKGPYNIGHRSIQQSYVLPLGGEQTIEVDIWYPTETEAGEPSVYYGIEEDPISIEGADPAAPVHEGGHPILAFSHGSFLYGGSSSFLMRRFASHGWIAVAPTHLGNTLFDYGETLPLSILTQRPMNDLAAVDALENLEWLGDYSRDSLILAGFSFGGYDSWALAGASFSGEAIQTTCSAGNYTGCSPEGISLLKEGFSDPRIKAVIPLAGANQFDIFGEEGRSGLAIPVLQMSGTEDQDNPQRVWDTAQGTELSWASIDEGCHRMFSIGGCPEIEVEEGFDIISAYVFAFARYHLLGDTGTVTEGLLDGSIQPWERVSIQSR
jgi:predicted dienelactone hydrolase